MKKSQKQIVWEQMSKKGYVSRNWCLSRYISRLSAIMNQLKFEGIIADGHWGRKITNKQDNDYYYVLPDFKMENKDGTVTLTNTN